MSMSIQLFIGRESSRREIKVQNQSDCLSLSLEKVCGSNGLLYRNLCELERDRCNREQNFQSTDPSYCKLRMSIYLIDKYFLSD